MPDNHDDDSSSLFVELAARMGCPLLMFDKALIKAFPDIAIRPRDLAQ